MDPSELNARIAERSTEAENDSEEDPEREEHPWVTLSPTTLIRGDIERIIYTGAIWDDNGPVAQPDGDWGFILSNPEVEVGTVYASTERDGGLARETGDGSPIDYKVVDQEDHAFEESYDADGNLKGVTAGSGNEFPATEADTFEEDKILVFQGGVAGDAMAKRLDVNGRPNAYIDSDGANTRGLIEFPTQAADEDDRPRVARYPILREDLEGEAIGLYLARRSEVEADYDGRSYWGEVLHYPSDDSEGEFVEAQKDRAAVVTNDGDAFDSSLVWHDEPVESSSDDDFDLSETDGDSEVDLDVLSDEEVAFAGNISDRLQDGETAFDLFGDFEAVVENNIEAGHLPEGAIDHVEEINEAAVKGLATA